MNKKIFGVLVVLCTMIFPVLVSAEENWFDIMNISPVITSNSPVQLGISGEPSGEITWETSDVNVCTVTNTGLVTPKSDGGCIVSANDGINEKHTYFTINVFGTIQKEVNDFLDTIPSTINLDVTKDIQVHDTHMGEVIDGFALEYLYSYIFENYTKDEDISISLDCDENYICKVKTSKVISAFYNGEMHYAFNSIDSTKTKTITANFKTVNGADKTAVMDALDRIKDQYDVYVNESIGNQSTFSDNILFKKAAIHNDVGSGISLKFDARAGDDTPGQAVADGFVTVGKNGAYYVAKTVKFYQILKTPELKGNKETALKEYIEKYLLKSNQKAEVEKTDMKENDKTIYKITISEKPQNNLISMLFSPFFMKVKADSSYTIYTAIEEDANMVLETNNNSNTSNIKPPKTFDPINTYLSLLLISGGGIMISLKKYKESKR